MGTIEKKKIIQVVRLKSIERSTCILSTFRDGYTTDWAFKLPIAYREALDIRLTPRMVDGKEQQVLTQGNAFSFKAGDVIYDASLAYALDWSKALKMIRVSLQVVTASPAGFTGDGSPPISIRGDTDQDVVLNRYFEGNVEFAVFTVSGNGLSEFRRIQASQTEFVRFLQQGEMFAANSEIIRLKDIRESAYPTKVSHLVAKEGSSQ